LLALPEDERAALLAEVAGLDPLMATEAASLLSSSDPATLARLAAPEMPDRIGRFEVRGVRGRGGMGIVFEAFDPKHERMVALKVVGDDFAVDARSMRRLEREARLQGRLSSHPNIATLFETDSSGDTPLLVMELVEGESLRDRIDRGAIPLWQAISFVRQIANALAHAHQAGVVHRDLKPENVMIAPDGIVKLLDFGISDVFGQMDAVDPLEFATRRAGSQMIGSLGYMSPEQLSGGVVDFRTDLWSLGCVLFECITGRQALSVRPTSDGRAWTTEIRWSLLDRGQARRMPRALRQLLHACLAESRDARPESAGLIRDVIDRAVRARDRRRAILLGAFAIVIAVAGTILASRPRIPPVELVQIRGDNVVQALDARGRVVWERQFAHGVRKNGEQPPDGDPPTRWVVNGKSRGVLVAGRDEANIESLYLLDFQRGSVIWSHPIEWNVPINAKGDLMCKWTKAIPWPEPVGQAIMLGLNDYPWYGGAVQFVSFDGRLLDEYDHPGSLTPESLTASSGDSTSALFLFGGNSSARFAREVVPFETRQHCFAVVRLDPPQVGGQAFPYSQFAPSPRDWPTEPRAAESAYLLIAPITPDASTQPGRGLSAPDRSSAVRFRVYTADGRIFSVDDSLRPIDCYVALGTPAAKNLVGHQTTPVLWIGGGHARSVEVPVVF